MHVLVSPSRHVASGDIPYFNVLQSMFKVASVLQLTLRSFPQVTQLYPIAFQSIGMVSMEGLEPSRRKDTRFLVSRVCQFPHTDLLRATLGCP